MMTRFSLGNIGVTVGANDYFSAEQLTSALKRHCFGDWGDLNEEDKEANEFALREGSRIFSVYEYPEGKLYIITEADRSQTTLLLPDEY